MQPYDITKHGGKTVDWLTKSALLEAERLLGYPLTIMQGSYNAGGVAASGGTHDGGGVVDLAAYDHAKKVKTLRSLGFAAWYRPELPGVWGPHIHAVQVGNQKLSPAAAAQVDDYFAGRNGLASNGPDLATREYVGVVWRWPFPKRVSSARLILRARRILQGAK